MTNFGKVELISITTRTTVFFLIVTFHTANWASFPPLCKHTTDTDKYS